MPITDQDKKLIADSLAHELEYEVLLGLDERLTDPDFKAAYEAALDAKYSSKSGKLRGYLPMIVLGILLVLGVILIATR